MPDGLIESLAINFGIPIVLAACVVFVLIRVSDWTWVRQIVSVPHGFLGILVKGALGTVAGVGAVSVVVGGWVLVTSLIYCHTSIVARVSIPGTPWHVEHLFSSCGGLDAGYMRIEAKDETKHRTVVIAEYSSEKTGLALDKENDLVVTLPSLTSIHSRRDQFDGVKVIYRFTPREHAAH